MATKTITVKLVPGAPMFYNLGQDHFRQVDESERNVEILDQVFQSTVNSNAMCQIAAGPLKGAFVLKACIEGDKGFKVSDELETYYVDADGLNLRQLPFATAKKIGTIPYGTKISDAQLCDGMTWAWSAKLGGFFATANGKNAYVSKSAPSKTASKAPPKVTEPAPGKASVATAEGGGSGWVIGAAVAAVVAKIAFF